MGLPGALSCEAMNIPRTYAAATAAAAPQGFSRAISGAGKPVYPTRGLAIWSDDRFFSPCPQVQVNGKGGMV